MGIPESRAYAGARLRHYVSTSVRSYVRASLREYIRSGIIPNARQETLSCVGVFGHGHGPRPGPGSRRGAAARAG